MIAAISSFAQVTISMEKKGDVYYVPGAINGVPLKFIFDTGASNVYISLTEALFMLKNGYLSDDDFGDTSYSQIANGDIVENTEVLLKEVKVGSIIIKDVRAMVSNTISAPLLLGQSAIQKLGPIQLDGNKLIVSSNNNMLPSKEKALNLYQKAFQLSELGKYDESIKIANDALKATDDNELKSTIYITIAHSYSKLGNLKKAIESLNNSLEEDVNNDIALFNLGECFYENKNITNALDSFNKLINRPTARKNTTMLANAYYYIGECYEIISSHNQAELAFKNSIDLEPTLYASLALGNLYFETKNFSDAIPILKQVVSVEPNTLCNLEIWHKLGFCYVQTYKIPEALDAFHNCMKVALENSQLNSRIPQDEALLFKHLPLDAELWIARLTDDPYLAIKYYDGLYEFLGNANNFVPQDFITWSDAVVESYNPLLKDGKLQEILHLGLTKFPDNPDILFGYTQLINDNDPKKLDYLQRILKQEFNYKPFSFDYATVYNNIAWVLHLNNKSSEGLTYAEHAIRKDPSLDYSWETLGEIYYKLGRYQDAIDAMTKCIELNGSSQKAAYEYRAKAYQQLGKKRESKKDLDIARHL